MLTNYFQSFLLLTVLVCLGFGEGICKKILANHHDRPDQGENLADSDFTQQSATGNIVSKIVRIQSCHQKHVNGAWSVPEELEAPYLYESKMEDILREFQEYYQDSFYVFNLTKPWLDSGNGDGEFKCDSTMVKVRMTRKDQAEGISNNNIDSGETATSSEYNILPNGYLKIEADNTTSFLPPEMYCVSSSRKETVEIIACLPTNQTMVPQLRRCLPFFRSLSFVIIPENGSFVDVTMAFKQDPWDLFRDSRYPDAKPKRPFYSHKMLGCQGQQILITDPNVVYTDSDRAYVDVQVQKNGDLLGRYRGNDKWEKLDKLFKTKEFCIDTYFVEKDEHVRPEYRRMIFLCFSKEAVSPLKSAYKYMIFPGLFFLGLILLIYVLVWHEQNVHGKTAIGFIFCMFLYFLTLFLNNLETFAYRSKACCVNGVIQHFANMSMYWWMAVLNFDVWSTLSSMVATNQRSKGTKRFLVYCACAFSGPLIVVTVAVILHSSYTVDNDKVALPQYGFTTCSTHPSVFAYYNLPPALLAFIISIVFGILTIRTLFAWKKQAGALTSTQANSARKDWILAFKLFCLTGISWGLDLIWSVFYENEDSIALGWWIVDIYHFSQTIFLFWIFVVKKEIKDQLCRNYKIARCVFGWLDEKYQGLVSTSASSNSTQSSSG